MAHSATPGHRVFSPPATTYPEFARATRSSPLVTIGIPAFNRPQLLAEALASVAGQQGFDAFEVVVSDDGALPENRHIVETSAVANIRYYANRPALGAVNNWNRCIDLAAGAWVTILHEDDLLYPWFLQSVTPRLRAGLAAVCTRCVQGKTPAALRQPASLRPPHPYAPLWFLKGSMTPFPGVLFSRELATRLGGFPSAEGGLADYVFWYRLACAGRVEVFREPAAFYRVNEGQWTDREWPTMLRRAHGLRLRVAREQLPDRPGLGRWIARFYTARMAGAYARRFAQQPAALARARRLARIPFSRIPSGWVWALLRLLSHSR